MNDDIRIDLTNDDDGYKVTVDLGKGRVALDPRRALAVAKSIVYHARKAAEREQQIRCPR